jgi:hypothetical protein
MAMSITWRSFHFASTLLIELLVELLDARGTGMGGGGGGVVVVVVGGDGTVFSFATIVLDFGR